MDSQKTRRRAPLTWRYHHHHHHHHNNNNNIDQSRTAELRWKWVENYCYERGCERSQNQCNDKWDNLLRDYKKVRDYQRCVASDGQERPRLPSYWSMEKHERKEKGLPTNLVCEVYDALTDVLNRRCSLKPPSSQPAGAVTPLSSCPPPPPPPPPTLPPAAVALGTSVSVETSDDSAGPSDTKKRRRNKPTSPGGGSSVVRGATVLAQTLLACEERREKRHRELLEVEERRLRLEEQRTEVHRQGISGLISAVNSLSGAILALVSDRKQ
ncbi:hypothetical protein QJS10_CPA03g02507 [Acorus calamus]|uniref:Myb/SANT-like DNA-binding domain-containing protein n=1 Tax=Acorus calamus TaxID=4465 RepID=A0AAV9FA93_ACOCL|nr:hypothetical protein QJS10_CPA03g02507 [Acorus calamus]